MLVKMKTRVYFLPPPLFPPPSWKNKTDFFAHENYLAVLGACRFHQCFIFLSSLKQGGVKGHLGVVIK